jgi:hypothetical protein
MIDNERANATFTFNFPNGLPKPVTQYDLTKAWNDGWATCLRDKEPAIRADEREQCRAELREQIYRLIDTMPDSEFAHKIYEWAQGEAFGDA